MKVSLFIKQKFIKNHIHQKPHSSKTTFIRWRKVLCARAVLQATFSQRECVGASVRSAEVRRVLWQDEVYTLRTNKREWDGGHYGPHIPTLSLGESISAPLRLTNIHNTSEDTEDGCECPFASTTVESSAVAPTLSRVNSHTSIFKAPLSSPAWRTSDFQFPLTFLQVFTAKLFETTLSTSAWISWNSADSTGSEKGKETCWPFTQSLELSNHLQCATPLRDASAINQVRTCWWIFDRPAWDTSWCRAVRHIGRQTQWQTSTCTFGVSPATLPQSRICKSLPAPGIPLWSRKKCKRRRRDRPGRSSWKHGCMRCRRGQRSWKECLDKPNAHCRMRRWRTHEFASASATPHIVGLVPNARAHELTTEIIPVAADSFWVSAISHTSCMYLKCSILCRNQWDQTRDLPACGLTNPTTNWKTTKQNGIMTKAHQDQRTIKSPRQPRVTNDTNAKPKLQLNFFVCSTGSHSVSFVMTPPVISKHIDKEVTSNSRKSCICEDPSPAQMAVCTAEVRRVLWQDEVYTPRTNKREWDGSHYGPHIPASETIFIKNHFHQKTFFIKIQFHPKPSKISSKTIKIHFHPKTKKNWTFHPKLQTPNPEP